MFARHRVFVCSLPHHLLQRHRTTPYTKNSHFRAVSVQDVAVSFQGSGADPYLVGRFSNAHTSSPDASLPRPFWVMRGHSRPRATHRRAPAVTLRHRPAPSSRAAPYLGQEVSQVVLPGHP